MKTLTCLTAGLVLTAAALHCPAATNYVILGDNFQAKINESAPGDILVVQAGVYPDNLNFNKPLTVLRSGTNRIQLAGSVQMQGRSAWRGLSATRR